VTTHEPTILAIETATHVLAVAICRGERVLAEVKWQAGLIHAERIIPSCLNMLEGLDLAWEDLDAVAVSQGPGSFTSLRIGFGTAKGIALAHDLPLVLIPTLEALAAQIPYCQHPVCATLDARKDEVYAAWFDTSSGQAARLTDDSLYSPEALVGSITEQTVCVGNGWVRYGAFWTERLKNTVRTAPPWGHLPTASVVGLLGMRRFINGVRDDPDTATPLYLRRSQAQEAASEKPPMVV